MIMVDKQISTCPAQNVRTVENLTTSPSYHLPFLSRPPTCPHPHPSPYSPIPHPLPAPLPSSSPSSPLLHRTPLPPPPPTGDDQRLPRAGRDAPAFTLGTRQEEAEGPPGAGPGAYNPENPALPSAPAFTMRPKTGAGAEEATGDAGPGEGAGERDGGRQKGGRGRALHCHEKPP